MCHHLLGMTSSREYSKFLSEMSSVVSGTEMEGRRYVRRSHSVAAGEPQYASHAPFVQSSKPPTPSIELSTHY